MISEAFDQVNERLFKKVLRIFRPMKLDSDAQRVSIRHFLVKLIVSKKKKKTILLNFPVSFGEISFFLFRNKNYFCSFSSEAHRNAALFIEALPL